MPSFGLRSRERLASCHPDLQLLFAEVIRHFDCSIISGHRDQKEQDQLYDDKLTKLKFPDSKHNQTPSRAIDVAPYPIDWNDKDRFYYFGGFVVGMAAAMGIKIRYGGDWDVDTEVSDETFKDLVHFELED